MARFRIFFGNPSAPAGAGDMACSVGGTGGASVAITALLAAACTVAGAGGASAGLTGAGALAGGAGGAGAVSAQIRGLAPLSASIGGAGGATSGLTGSGALGAAIGGAGAVSANLTAQAAGVMAATVGGVGGVSADLTGRPAGALDATVPGVGGVVARLGTGSSTGHYVDTREFIFQRIQAALKAISPRTTLHFPFGFEGDPFLNELDGRVYTRRRANVTIDSLEMPYAEVFPSPVVHDTLTIQDGDLTEARVRGVIVGYARADDAGDGLDATVRPLLHELSADLRLALEAAPYYTGTGVPAPMTERLGTQLRLVVENVEVVAGGDGPYGAVVIEFTVAYSFRPRWP